MSFPNKVQVHVAPEEEGVPPLFLLQTGTTESDALFVSKLPKDYAYTTFSLKASPEDADYILAPHAVRSLTGWGSDYLTRMKSYAKRYKKPLIIYTGGDLQHNVFIDDAIVIKGAQYRSLQKNNEIITPPFVEDLGESESIALRKKSARPVVSFCGWAAFPSKGAEIRYRIRNFLIDLASLGDSKLQVYKRGLYFRRKALALLEKDSRVDSRFIIRSSFSGNKNLISLSPEQAREEYIANMQDSDFVLAPKGDGNFSLRFFEALSLGRIPILIDTDTALPLTEVIDYDSCIIRVPYTQLHQLPTILAEFYDSLTDESFMNMQRAARAAFGEYLRYDSFLNYLFSTALPQRFVSKETKEG